jgi:hypothetical protein
MNMNRPNGFLRLGGAIILIIGLLGVVGILGPDSSQSIFQSYWWLGERESHVFIATAIALLFISFTFPALWQRYIVIIFGILEILIGSYTFFGQNIFGINLETPSDTIVHFIIGGWALYSVYGKSRGKR